MLGKSRHGECNVKSRMGRHIKTGEWLGKPHPVAKMAKVAWMAFIYLYHRNTTTTRPRVIT